MDIAHAGLKQQPFHTSGKPVTIIHYQSEQAARDFLHMIVTSSRGVGLLCGPECSGKKTVVRQFARSMSADIAVAMVDGTRLNTTDFLDAIHSQFSYETTSDSPDDSLNKLRKFIAQEAGRTRQPLLIVENIDKMYPSALLVLCKLAVLKSQGKYALRMVLVSIKPSFNIIHAPAMSALAARMLNTFVMGPMTPGETTTYLYEKLRVSDCASPETAFPGDICDDLYEVSRGWPGVLDRVAMRAIERAPDWPIRREHIYPPAVRANAGSSSDISEVKESGGWEVRKLYLTFNRKTLQEFELKDSKILIGRSELCDVSINSRHVSRYHAMLIRTDDVTHLVDLNSTNGTFVNSRRVRSMVLQHQDVISIGSHGIKLISPADRTRGVSEEQSLADTVKMKTLTDMRRLRAKAGVDIAPAGKREG